MTKKDINPNLSKFKAVNAFIFGGSFSIGTIKAGFDLQKVLEIADNQLENNAFYFSKNVSDVPVILPSEWENEKYLSDLKNEKIDLMCCNCPCSSLSQINRNASVDGKNNVHFYRLFDVFNAVEPKVFIIENAPTLVSIGLPILKDLVKRLGSKYRVSIIRDKAGNHEVAMIRERTLVVGWRRDVFQKMPIINQDAHSKKTVKDEIGDLYLDKTDDCKSKDMDEISFMYKHAIVRKSLMTALALQYNENKNGFRSVLEDKLSGHPRHLKEVKRIAIAKNAGKSVWDKTPYKLAEDHYFPSLTSVSEYLHPIQDRMLNLHELARIMNYPDGYDFSDPEKKCCIPVIQAIAQGVPANFGKYIATQARLGLEGKLKLLDDESVDVVFQHHIKHQFEIYTMAKFDDVTKLDDVLTHKLVD